MTAPPRDLLGALMRQDFFAFLAKVFEALHPGKPPLARAWYLQAICYALTEVACAPTSKQLCILVPPRHLKSITASVAFTAWLLGRDPTCKIMVANYSEELARHHAEMARTILQTKWYKALFPKTRIDPRLNRATEFRTTAGGGRKAVSVEGSITGFGADIIIVDDCMKADDIRSPARRDTLRHWFDNTLMTRPDDKGAIKIISIQQRLHEDDLPAYLADKGYEQLVLPAIAEKNETIAIGGGKVHHRRVGDLLDPGREGQDVLDNLRRQLGPVTFAAQYQQNPVAPEGNLIRMEWFGTYSEAMERCEYLKVVQSWDTGMTDHPGSDFSVCTTWGFDREEAKWDLLDVFRMRLNYPDLKRAVVRLQKQWQADRVLIEDAGSGKALWAEFVAQGPFRPLMIPPRLSKEERFNACLGEVEAGYILLPENAPWLDAFRSELKAFPYGRNDDQVDSFSQFINWQLANWRYILTEYDKSGRKRALVRLRERPW